MSLQKALIVLFALISLLSAGLSCRTEESEGSESAAGDAGDDDSTGDDAHGEAASPFCEIDESLIEDFVSGMTLRDKIAQMYVVGVQLVPWFPLPKARHLIEDLGVGGIYVQVLTGTGLSPEWSAKNMNQAQSLAMSRAVPVPLIVSIDQEGGIPQALNSVIGGTDQPGNMGLAATFDPQSAFASYSIMGEEMAHVGVNCDYAPVAELMISPDETSMYTRCFAERTEDVAAHTAQAVRGLQQNLVIATAKHFPSHSTAPGDEHFVLPVNSESEQDVREKYFPPFVAAIEAGVDMIMITHAVYSAWEDGVPTTFSRRLVTDVLRGELGFEGLIVTDDINMGSITLHPWDEFPDLMAIQAGADMVVDCGSEDPSMFGYAPENLIYPHDVKGQIEYIAAAVGDGRLTEGRIDESVRRILRAKMKYCLFENPYVLESAAAMHVGTRRHYKISARLQEKAITVVRNDDGLFPLDPDENPRVHVVAPKMYQLEMYPDAAWQNLAGTDLYREIRKIHPQTTGDTFVVGAGDFPINIPWFVKGARNSGADVLIIGTYDALYYGRQIELVQRLLDLDIPAILVALAMPYDLLAFPDAPTYLATYSNRDLALEVLARAVFGYATPTGRLPVSIPGMYEVGWRATGD